MITSLPTARFIFVTQDLTASPSIWTTQAPHCATPQPYFVPVKPTTSRKNHSSGISLSITTSYSFLLMRMVSIIVYVSCYITVCIHHLFILGLSSFFQILWLSTFKSHHIMILVLKICIFHLYLIEHSTKQ
ncbi:hypothetical protein D3C86_1515550 [compost metagenome]